MIKNRNELGVIDVKESFPTGIQSLCYFLRIRINGSERLVNHNSLPQTRKMHLLSCKRINANSLINFYELVSLCKSIRKSSESKLALSTWNIVHFKMQFRWSCFNEAAKPIICHKCNCTPRCGHIYIDRLNYSKTKTNRLSTFDAHTFTANFNRKSAKACKSFRKKLTLVNTIINNIATKSNQNTLWLLPSGILDSFGCVKLLFRVSCGTPPPTVMH